jgi:Ca-activated chloride channel family protein
MRFQAPIYFAFLILPLIFFVLWKFFDNRRDKKINDHFSKENIEEFGLIDIESKKKNWTFRLLALLSFGFLTIALARPQFGLKEKNVLVSESSVVFLIDLSRSMLTRDLSPSRLEVLKEEIVQTLGKLAEVRVGLVAFAGSVNVISPMTSDLEAVASYVESLSTDSVVSQGTRVEAGLEEAKGLFERSIGKDKFSNQSKVIILFSDGEDHQKKSVEYVQKMAKDGYKVFTVGVGTESGGFIPEGEFSSAYIKDVSGQNVISKPNFSFLKDVAKAGKGSFFYLAPANPLSTKLKSALDKIEGVSASQRQFVVRNELYQLFLVLAIVCFLISIFVKRL